MSADAYLDWEPWQEIRYEYINGELYAMTGDTVPRNDIAINLLSQLLPNVRAQGCQINMAVVKLQQDLCRCHFQRKIFELLTEVVIEWTQAQSIAYFFGAVAQSSNEDDTSVVRPQCLIELCHWQRQSPCGVNPPNPENTTPYQSSLRYWNHISL